MSEKIGVVLLQNYIIQADMFSLYLQRQVFYLDTNFPEIIPL